MFKLNSIYLKNFGIIIEEKVEFTSPITVFSGDNGQGKSTFLKAIYMNLFDKYEGNYEHYVRWGESVFENRIEFEYFGEKVVSELNYNNGASRRLEIGTEVFEGTKAKQKLSEILPPDLMMAASVSKENQIDIVTTSPARRREFLKRIYDINFNSEIDTLNVELEDNKEKLVQIEKEVYALENKTYDYPEVPQQEISEKDIENLKNERKSIEEYIRSLNERNEKVLNLISSLKEKEGFLSDIEVLLQEKTSNLSFLQNQLKDLKEKEIKFDPYGSLESLEDSVDKLTVEIKKIQSEAVVKPQSKIRKRSNTKKEDIQKQLTEKSLEKNQLVLKLENMKNGVCPECGKPYDKSDFTTIEKSLFSLTEEIEILKKELEKEEKEIFLNDQAIEKSDKEQKEYDTYLLKLEASDRSLEVAEKTLRKRKIELQNEFKVKTTERDEQEIKLNSSIKSMEKGLNSLSQEFEEKKKQVENFKLEINEKQPEKIDLSVTLKLEEIKERIEKFNNLQKEINTICGIISNIKNQEKEDLLALENKKKERDSYQKEVNSLNEAITILKTNLPQFILVKLTKVLEDLTNYFLQKTYDGRYNLNFIPLKESLRLVYGPKKFDVKLASGYEQQIFSTVFKGSLSSGIQNRVLILDEVDSQASKENSEKLFRFLYKAMGQFFDQLIIVTHKPSITEMIETEFSGEIIEIENGKILI